MVRIDACSSLISVSWQSSSPSDSLWLAGCGSNHPWGRVLNLISGTDKFVPTAIHSGWLEQPGGRWTSRFSDYGRGWTLIKSSKRWGNNSPQIVSAFTPSIAIKARPVWTGPPQWQTKVGERMVVNGKEESDLNQEVRIKVETRSERAGWWLGTHSLLRLQNQTEADFRNSFHSREMCKSAVKNRKKWG